jgi:hypothetical protein
MFELLSKAYSDEVGQESLLSNSRSENDTSIYTTKNIADCF